MAPRTSQFITNTTMYNIQSKSNSFVRESIVTIISYRDHHLLLLLLTTPTMVTVTYVTPSEAAALFATTATASRSSAAAFIINNDTGRQISTDLQAQLSNNPSYIDRSQHPSPSFYHNNVDQGESKRDLQPGQSNSNKRLKVDVDDAFIIDLSDVPQQPPILKPSDRIKEGASKYTGVYSDKTKKKWISKIQIDGKYRYIGYYEKEEEAAVDYARALFKYKG
eukprot:scaffold518_cov105-Skeletonema_menzelii.AAC.6